MLLRGGSSTLTFILAGGEGQRLYPLTQARAKPVVPIGGIHRLMDFSLSNCFNSGLRRVNILTQYQCESVHCYIRALNRGSLWGNSREEPLRCLCPAVGKRYRGTADAVFQNLWLVQDAKPQFVVILCGDHVYRMDYRNLIRFHQDRGAELTIAGLEWPRSAASKFGVFETDSQGRVAGFEEKPHAPKPISNRPSKSLISMGVYVFNARTLVEALSDDAGRNTSHDFAKDIIPGLVEHGQVSVYNFTEMGIRLGSYWRDVGTLDAYYGANMELLSISIGNPNAVAAWPPLYRFDPDRHAGRSSENGRCAGWVLDSFIAKGVSVAPGSRVVHSVLSPGVQIGHSAETRNAILLNNVRVGAGARIQRAIVDENVRIADGAEIGYDSNRDRDYGLVTENGVVVIPANTCVKDRHARNEVHRFAKQDSIVRADPNHVYEGA